jgi:hypothetical protein
MAKSPLGASAPASLDLSNAVALTQFGAEELHRKIKALSAVEQLLRVRCLMTLPKKTTAACNTSGVMT